MTNLTIHNPPETANSSPDSESVSVWGVPFTPLTYQQTLDQIDEQVLRGVPVQRTCTTSCWRTGTRNWLKSTAMRPS